MSLNYYRKRPQQSLDQWLKVQRETRPNIPVGPSALTPSQLTDLLNYVLGLSRGEAISSVVVGCWVQKTEQRQAQSWCETQLVKAKIMPRRRHQHHDRRAPWVLDAWIAKRSGAAA